MANVNSHYMIEATEMKITTVGIDLSIGNSNVDCPTPQSIERPFISSLQSVRRAFYPYLSHRVFDAGNDVQRRQWISMYSHFY